MNPDAYAVDLASVDHVGRDLSRPECILAQSNGALWVCDDRSGVLHIGPDGAQTRIGAVGGVPNGIAMGRDGAFVIADIELGRVLRLERDGRHETLLDELEGRRLGAVNFVLFDSRWRLWVTVSTRTYPRRAALEDRRPDGYLMLIEGGRARIAADGFSFTNECRLSSDETVMYVAETALGRVTAFDVDGDARLSNRRVFGPERLWDGALIDGVTVDAAGGVWVTEITRNALAVLSPAGEVCVALEDPAADRVDFPTSLTFGGPDLREAWIGSLRMDRLPHFRAPAAGLAPPHWRLD